MNNLLKSLFISVYAGYVYVATGLATLRLVGTQDFSWFGVILVHAPMAVFFAIVMLFRNLPRSHPYLPAITVVTLGGFALTMFVARSVTHTAIAFGASGLIAYLAYLLWYSRFSRAPAKLLSVGARLPDFDAVDTNGESFSAAQLAGKPAVLLFFRGNWCPLCMAQIREIADQYRLLADNGVQVILISPQPQKNSRRLAQRFEAPMRFVVDSDNHVARQLGIAWAHAIPAGMQLLGYQSESVLPTVIVVDAERRIVLADQTDNYRVRPEPATFIAALKNHSGT